MWSVIGKLALSLMIVSGTAAFAEETSVEAVVNANKISLQDYIELSLTVHGSKGNVAPINLPLIEGFDARYVGPSSKFTVINGVSSSEKSFVYNLFPSKVGKFTIPALELIVDGKTYKTTAIEIEVTDKPADKAPSPDAQAADEQQDIHDKVFMKAAVAHEDVYVGEKTPLIMKVFVNGLSLQLASVPYLTPEGFTADATANMKKSKEVINGISYDVLTFDTNIYPTQPGTIKVGPFAADGELLYRVKQTNDIFGDFFARTESRPITLNAEPITLRAKALPAEGKPADFNGAVGAYDFKATVGPASVKVGDPLTLRMTLTGQGDLKNVALPVFNDSRFKVYDPQIKNDEASKNLEQVIIPASKDITEVPAITFSFFDPKEKKYRTITQGPFPVKVTAQASGEEFKAYGFENKSAVEKPLVKLEDAQSLLQKLLAQLSAWVRNLYVWLFVILAVLVWVGVSIWQSFQKRLEKDERFARQWKAEGHAKELLKNTKALMEGNSKDFYTGLYKTLNDYLADKMHLPAASLTPAVIEARLKEKNIDGGRLEEIKKLLERCDLVRFATVEMPQEQKAKDFLLLQNLMDYLPKILK